jgi:DNA-binding NarL/FixJ family response regulator
VADEITCLIADDHEVVREGLRLALSRSPRIRVIGEAADGASAVALAERRRPDVERSLLQRGLESGARGYILKEAPHETLLRAIEKVAAGETFVDPGLMAEFVSAQGQSDVLTPREREILQLLADGMSNADVAAKLFISQETVKSHVRHILSKLEADTRTQAVAIALREAMID